MSEVCLGMLADSRLVSRGPKRAKIYRAARLRTGSTSGPVESPFGLYRQRETLRVCPLRDLSVQIKIGDHVEHAKTTLPHYKSTPPRARPGCTSGSRWTALASNPEGETVYGLSEPGMRAVLPSGET